MSKVYSVMLKNGDVVIGELIGEAGDGGVSGAGHALIAYPITIVPQMGQDDDGNPIQQMGIQPYFPMADYKASDGIQFSNADIMLKYPSIDPIAQAHINYANAKRMEDTGLVTASAMDLPENQNSVAASEMTGGGLRMSD